MDALFAPFELPGGFRLENRLALAPMTTYSSQPDGTISPDELPYLERRARGGFGTVLTAACAVHPTGWAFRGQWQAWDDRFLPSLAAAAAAIRRGGACALLQIHHGGRQCPPDLCGGEPLSASAVPAERPNAAVPRAMTEAKIEEVVTAFGHATARAVAAGFDGVEIHGANTYLLQQFMSPHSNRRDDAWGRDRRKFALAVTDAVLAAAPPEFVVGYRFSPEEPETPGLRLADTYALLDTLVERRLDFLHVSLRDVRQAPLHAETEGAEPTLSRLARHIAGRMPLMAAGSVRTPEDARVALDLGADLVAVGRAAVSDPEWAARAQRGEPVRPKLPMGDYAAALHVPAGLAAKIAAVPGWFEVETAPVGDVDGDNSAVAGRVG